MALTPAEKQKAYRERKHAIRKAAVAKPTKPSRVYRRPFSEFLNKEKGGSLSFFESLDFVGVDVRGDLFEDEQRFDREPGWEEHGDLAPFSSLSRAIALVEVFIESARELSLATNAYKLAEIEARIDQLSRKPPSDPAATRAALEKHARLIAVREAINKQVRHTFPVITAEEEQK